MTKTYSLAKSYVRALHSKIEETVQYPLGISFRERQGSRLLPKPTSFSYILLSLLDYFYLLGQPTTSRNKQAPSNLESIHIRHGVHGFEMGKTNLSAVQQWARNVIKDWEILLVTYPQIEYALDLNCFTRDSEITITPFVIYVRTLRRKLIRGTLNRSRMHVTGRLKWCKVWNRFISTFLVVSGTKRSALSNHSLESFEQILQGLVSQKCSKSIGHMIFGHSNMHQKEWAFLKDKMLSQR